MSSRALRWRQFGFVGGFVYEVFLQKSHKPPGVEFRLDQGNEISPVIYHLVAIGFEGQDIPAARSIAKQFVGPYQAIQSGVAITLEGGRLVPSVHGIRQVWKEQPALVGT